MFKHRCGAACAVFLLSPVALANTPAAANYFNPQISLILDTAYYTDSENGTYGALAEQLPGLRSAVADEHGHDHAHGALEEGFNLRELELVLSASVDAYFDGYAAFAISTDSIEVEEAYFTTRSLPAGLRMKGGRFLSGIGYHNAKHVHQWAFADQNLAYASLLGEHGLVDNGVQLTWLPELPFYAQVGVEWLQGSAQERFGVLLGEADDHAEHDHSDEDPEHSEAELPTAKSGPRLITTFVKLAPELGHDHSLQVGGWYARAKQDQALLAHEHDGHAESLLLDGDATLWGLDLVYKYSAGSAWGKGNLVVQAEYLRLRTDWTVVAGEDSGATVRGEQDGAYIQALYGIAPRWHAGVRYDASGLTHELRLPDETESLSRSERIAAVLTWQPTEFSYLRLQYAQVDLAGDAHSVNQLILQFNYSLGAHGAHSF